METTQLQSRLDYLQGQVMALQAAVRGLIYTHPEPHAATRIIDQLLEEAQANGLASEAATDEALLGLARSCARLLPTTDQMHRARRVMVEI